MSYILALDQGTSSTRAIAYTTSGEFVTSSQYAITQYYPQSGWVEHDPEEIWQKTLTAMQDVVSQVDRTKIIAVGITNQRETTLIWNKRTGECLAPAIVWQDRRTQHFCDEIAGKALEIQQKTGLILDPYFSATKLNWLLTHIQQAQSLADQGELAFGTIDSFLIWRLTNGKSHLTDVTNASRTMLFNIDHLKWDEDLLKTFAIPDSVLPEVRSSDSHYGYVDKSHLGFEIPITGVAGDQQAALIGQGCFENGMIKSTYGTGAFLMLNTGHQKVLSKHKLLTTIAYQIKGETVYGLEGSIYQAGTTIKWLRDELKLLSSSAESETLAASLGSNDGVYLLPSFTGLGAPHWLTRSGAIISGLSLSSNKAHFARAALESVCYQTREVLTCMREDSKLDLTLLRVDGGMTVNQWLLQFLSNQCQLTVQKPNDIETTAKGAAILAALGIGYYQSLSDLKAVWDVEREYKPLIDLTKNDSEFNGWVRVLNDYKNAGKSH